jgi:hypothetical protein
VPGDVPHAARDYCPAAYLPSIGNYVGAPGHKIKSR